MWIFLIPLLFGFTSNLASAFSTALSRRWGERRGSIIAVVLRDILGIPVWAIGFLMAFRAPSPDLFTPEDPIILIGWLLVAVGGLIIVAALISIRLPAVIPSARDALVQRGLYGYVRHPIHSGTLLEFGGLFLISPTQAVSLACLLGVGWVILQTLCEERDLLQRLPEYREYMERVPCFLPRFTHIFIVVSILVVLAVTGGCVQQPVQTGINRVVDRLAKIPATATKMSPENDSAPPVIYSDQYETPIPLPGEVNTAGLEDSPFVMPDGNTLYFFFTPDVSVPVEKQILDGVTGIYVSKKVSGRWGKPERIFLQDPGKLAGDGCEFVLGDVMWFCSVREGYSGLHWFTAEYKDGMWQNWRISDFRTDFKVGELHITADGNELYFHSDRPGGKGGRDIWMSVKVNGEWQDPVNIAAVNTEADEGWPALSQDGNELWFTRNYGIWRSRKIQGEWQNAELIVSPLAGEPSLDDAGNLYFVHHFYQNEKMVEADLYVAYKK